MAYRSLKNILGETSLERKCRFLFGLCLFVLIAGSFWWYGSRTERLVYATTRNTGRQLVDAYMLQYHWQKLEPEQKYTDLIRRLASDLGNRTFDSSQLLRPDAAAGERAAYKRLDLAVLDYFRSHPAPSPAAGGEAGEYR
ncbi:MAG: hypothetical protein ACKONH_03030, partial [Planctomycetia bacterium]